MAAVAINDLCREHDSFVLLHLGEIVSGACVGASSIHGGNVVRGSYQAKVVVRGGYKAQVVAQQGKNILERFGMSAKYSTMIGQGRSDPGLGASLFFPEDKKKKEQRAKSKELCPVQSSFSMSIRDVMGFIRYNSYQLSAISYLCGSYLCHMVANKKNGSLTQNGGASPIVKHVP